jgi:hypothetical protein
VTQRRTDLSKAIMFSIHVATFTVRRVGYGDKRYYEYKKKRLWQMVSQEITEKRSKVAISVLLLYCRTDD